MKYESNGLWHPIKSDARTESNALTHYCRNCEQSFETTERESAHRSALIHHIKEHAPDIRFTRCDRYCQLKAQQDELGLGRRLYGPGVAPTTPLLRAEQLFGDDDDHA